jgi:hypothetical protein
VQRHDLLVFLHRKKEKSKQARAIITQNRQKSGEVGTTGSPHFFCSRVEVLNQGAVKVETRRAFYLEGIQNESIRFQKVA